MTYRFSAFITKEDGKDVESARANLGEAIELFIETWGWQGGLKLDEFLELLSGRCLSLRRIL